MTKKKIMIIEDNKAYSDAAKQYFSTVENVETVFGKDYDQAMNILTEYKGKLDGALIDCFFPKQTGSGDRSLGQSLIEKMINSNEGEKKRRDSLEKLGKLINLDSDLELKGYVKNMFYSFEHYGGNSEEVINSLEHVSKACGKDAATKIAKNSLGVAYSKSDQSFSDYYGELEDAIQKSEDNQPLGLLVAHEVEKMNLPFMLVTSKYHHNHLAEPVFAYACKKGWRIAECYKSDKKGTPEFWKGAFDQLKEK